MTFKKNTSYTYVPSPLGATLGFAVVYRWIQNQDIYVALNHRIFNNTSSILTFVVCR